MLHIVRVSARISRLACGFPRRSLFATKLYVALRQFRTVRHQSADHRKPADAARSRVTRLSGHASLRKFYFTGVAGSRICSMSPIELTTRVQRRAITPTLNYCCLGHNSREHGCLRHNLFGIQPRPPRRYTVGAPRQRLSDRAGPKPEGTPDGGESRRVGSCLDCWTSHYCGCVTGPSDVMRTLNSGANYQADSDCRACASRRLRTPSQPCHCPRADRYFAPGRLKSAYARGCLSRTRSGEPVGGRFQQLREESR